MAAKVLPLRPQPDAAEAAAAALDRLRRYLARVDGTTVAHNTVVAYDRQASAFVAWLAENPGLHPDAFVDTVGAESAVAAWRTHLARDRGLAPPTVNQAQAAVKWLFEHGTGIRIQVKGVTVPPPGEPEALTVEEQGQLERAAQRRMAWSQYGARDRAVIGVLLYTGARAAECAALDLEHVTAGERSGAVRLWGKGGKPRTVPLVPPARPWVRDYLLQRGDQPGGLWLGRHGPLTVDGITNVVMAVAKDAGLPSIRPHRLRHTFATRCRDGRLAGVDPDGRTGGMHPAVLQYLLGHASPDTTARYYRAGAEEAAREMTRVFGGR
jgi:integrase